MTVVDAFPRELGGCYRAAFLGADSLGNVTVVVPSVSGNTPVEAKSAAFDLVNLPVPGSMGWVIYEGENPATPVWLGSATPSNDWNTGWGVILPFANVATTQTAITTAVDVLGAAVAWTPNPNRMYVHHARLRITQNGGGGSTTVSITDSSNATIGNGSSTETRSTTGHLATHEPNTEPRSYPATPRVDKVRISATAVADLGGNCHLWIEDVGPAVRNTIVATPPSLYMPSNTSFGVLDHRFGVHSGAAIAGFGGAGLPVYSFGPTTFVSGRLYKLTAQARASNPGPYFSLLKDGVALTDAYGARDTGSTWGGVNYTFWLPGSIHAGTHTWEVRATSATAVAGTIYTDQGGMATIEDAGPEFGPITIVPAPTVVVPGGWQAAALINSWANFGSGWQTARYRLVGDDVEIQGLIKSGNFNTVAFILPVGFRPTAFLRFYNYVVNASGINGACNIDIDTSGNVTIGSPSSAMTGTANPVGNVSISNPPFGTT